MNKSIRISPLTFVCAAALICCAALPKLAFAQFGQPVTSLGSDAQQQEPATASRDMTERSTSNTITSKPDARARLSSEDYRRDESLRASAGSSHPTRKPVINAFSAYSTTVTGKKLEVFGHSLFSDVPTTFAPFDAAPINGDYVIGTGDELQIRGWGMIQVDVTAVVDRNGAIYIPRVGAVKVAGLKYRDLQGFLKQSIGKNFSNFEITASISQTRALQIYVVGHATRPGTYTLNAMSTLLNALFTSGGPDSTGSMRRIQLKRAGASVVTFDLYDMLTKGDKSHDLTLRDGDVIFIPEVGPLVALTGSIKTPAIYELNGEASLADLLQWAGGVDSSADERTIIVEKAINNVYQTVSEVKASKSTMNKELARIPVISADVIRVFSPQAIPVTARIDREFVRVSGEVKQSGVFQIRKGESLRELLMRIGGATDDGYIFATQLTRESVRMAQQIKLDDFATRFERDLQSVASKRLSGITDKEAIAIQDAEYERSRQLVEKLRAVRAEGRIVLELEDGNAQVKNLPELPLQDGDSIVVPRKPGTVEVIGAVFQTNSYIFKPYRSVKDYLDLAGGITANGDKSEMYVVRADGTARSARAGGWFGRGLGGMTINPGDTVVVPEEIERSSFRQSFKEWTTIFYQFGLGAAGLKVLKN